MPFVLTGNRETDTMCRFGMAEIQQGWWCVDIWVRSKKVALPVPKGSVDPTV